MATFDAIADRFDAFRSLPQGVPEALRAHLRDAVGPLPGPLLEVGAGTGRFGQAFAAAGDDYVGTDPSRLMLERFAPRWRAPDGRPPRLIQADGVALPLADGSFGIVLMFSVLSGIAGWRRLLAEARRVLRKDGALVVGRTVRPPDGVDARMKAQLATILAALGAAARRPGAGRDDPRDWLAQEADSHVRTQAIQWESPRSPRDFLLRHPTGARFAALPESVRRAAMTQLSEWARATFGPLDVPAVETAWIELDIFRFRQGV